MKILPEKIAVDIVLLPPDKIMNLAIKINKCLLGVDKRVILDKKNCLPHITLAMGCLNKKDLKAINKTLEDTAGKFLPMDLELIPGKETLPVLTIKKIKKLRLLHQAVMNRMRTYFSYNANSKMIYKSPDQKIDKITIDYIKGFPLNSGFKNYYPHITIGMIEAEGIKAPVKFRVKKMALCHLGNYCTCKRILTLYEG